MAESMAEVAMGDDSEELQPKDRKITDKTRKWLEKNADGHWHDEVSHSPI